MAGTVAGNVHWIVVGNGTSCGTGESVKQSSMEISELLTCVVPRAPTVHRQALKKT